jgi:hypothetical protein
MKIARSVAVLLAILPMVALTAQSPDDPPARVGRVSLLGGAVSLRPGGADDWTEATINYPLSAGDELWTDADGKTEIALGGAAIRLAPYTGFAFLALDDQTTQVRLSEGSLQVRLRDLADDEVFEIDTPNGAVTLLRAGAYRIDVESSGDETRVTVRDGAAELAAAGSAISVEEGETVTVFGVERPRYDMSNASRPDEWERWCADRDRRRDLSRSAQYVSRDIPGYEDLDDYGEWRQTAEYGPVWAPRRVVAGWAPYRDGRWVWVDPWGWTWVDDAPWGFAPFHYGRWVYWGGGWAWVPGHVVVRPVYAPALVVFLGGANWSVSVATGGYGVGWFPLGPGELYVPAYRASQWYVRSVNITNVNVTNINLADMTNVRYRNREAPGGVTVVTRETFVGARPVRRGLVVMPRDRLIGAPIAGAAAPFAPTRESVAPRRGRPVRQPPANVVTRRVVVRNTPPPPPVPFSARERALQSRPGRPLDPGTMATLRGRGPGLDVNRYLRPATGEGGAELRPVRRGLPEPRAVTPGERGRPGKQPDQDRGRRPRDEGRNQPSQPAERPAQPPKDNRGWRPREGDRPRPEPPPPPPPPPPAPLPTPPRLPAVDQPPARPARPPQPPPPPPAQPADTGRKQPDQPHGRGRDEGGQGRGRDEGDTTRRRRP